MRAMDLEPWFQHFSTIVLGFNGDGFNCTNYNECDPSIDASLAHNCHNLANCSDTIGSFDCTCISGYEGNGTFCAEVNECVSQNITCPENATCFDLTDNYECRCQPGFDVAGRAGNSSDITSQMGSILDKNSNDTCVDIDECAKGLD